MKKDEKSAELRHLRAENKRLARENEYLRHRAEQLGERTREKGREQEVLSDVLSTAHTSRAKTYFGFLLFRVRTSRWFRIYDKTSFAVRGFLLASKIWRFFMWLFALVGIGAQVILVIGIFTVLLPAVLLFSAIMAAVSFFSYRKWNAIFASAVRGRRVYLLFLPKKRKKCDYLLAMAREFSHRGIVFVVSRSVFGGGLLRLRCIGDDLYVIPFGYYFSLRGRLSLFGASRVIVIH